MGTAPRALTSDLTAVGNHSHTSGGGGSHNHSTTSQFFADDGADPDKSCGKAYQGTHTHTSSASGGHGHTAASPGTHAHVVNASDGRPPYYELAPITAGVGGANQRIGIICIWTGTLANIPADWELCDGTSSAPNLLNKFIRGVATGGTDPGGTGGNLTHIHTVQLGGDHSHALDSQGASIHTCNNSTWSHNHNPLNWTIDPVNNELGEDFYGPSHNHGNLSNAGNHTNHALTDAGHNDHTYGTGSSLPAYYEVAFIYSLEDKGGGDGAGAVVMGTDSLILDLLLEGVI